MAQTCLIVGTLRRTNDFKYTSAAVVVGKSDLATVTRQYDAYDPSISKSVSTTPITFYVPTAGEAGTFFCITYDSDGKYTYQEFTYDAALTVTEVTANKLTDGTKTISIFAFTGSLFIVLSAGTGTTKLRISATKG